MNKKREEIVKVKAEQSYHQQQQKILKTEFLTSQDEDDDEQQSPSPIVNSINNFVQQFWRDILGSSRYILAPMVDQSELAFRILVRRYQVQCTYSPMFNASIFVKDKKYRRDCMQVLPELDRPLIIQVFDYYLLFFDF